MGLLVDQRPCAMHGVRCAEQLLDKVGICLVAEAGLSRPLDPDCWIALPSRSRSRVRCRVVLAGLEVVPHSGGS